MYVQSFYFLSLCQKNCASNKDCAQQLRGRGQIMRSGHGGALIHDRDGRLAVFAWINTRLSVIFTAYCRSRVQMVRIYVWLCAVFVSIGGVLWGYDTG